MATKENPEAGKLPKVASADVKQRDIGEGKQPERGGSGGSRRGNDGGSLSEPKPISVDHGMLGFFAAGGDDRAVPLKVVGPRDVELSPDDIITPPDGGWGWVIVFVAFLSNVFVDGTIFAFALIQNEIIMRYEKLNKLDDPEVKLVPWAGSLILGFNFLSGPITSSLADRFGFRAVSMVGSWIAGTCFVIVGCSANQDTELPNLPIMLAFYGVIAGLATGMIYMPSVVCVGYYFDKKRALAVGLAISGTGCGTFVMALLTKALIDSIGWRGAMLVQGCILFSCCMIGSLYRPLEADYHGDDCFKDLTKMSKRMRTAMAELYKKDAVVGANGDDTKSGQGSLATLRFEKGSLTSIRKRILVESGVSRTRIRDPGRSVLSYNFAQDTFSQESVVEIDEERAARDGFDITFEENPADVTVVKVASKSDMNRPTVRPEAYVGGSTSGDRGEGVKYVYTLQKKEKRKANDAEAELRRRTSGSKHAGSTISAPGSGEVVEEPPPPLQYALPQKPTFGQRVGKLLRRFRIASMPAFWLIGINGFLVTLGYPIPYIYLSSLAIDNDVDAEVSAYLLSFMGMANTIGRILCGYFSDSPKVNSLYVNNFSGIVAGVVTLAIPFLAKANVGAAGFLIYALVFGASMACFATLRSILIRDFIGLSVLAAAFGLCLAFQGVAAIISSPMAVAMAVPRGNSLDYTLPFMVSGALIIAASLITFLLPLAQKRQAIWDAQREKEEEQNKKL